MLKVFSLTFAVAFIFGLLALTTPPVSASIKEDVCKGATLAVTGPAGDCTTGVSDTKANNLIGKIVNYITIIVVIVAVIMIIIGGFKYITSGGDANKIGSAKNTVIYAIIGLAVVAFAQFIVKFVFNTSNNVQA